RLHRREGELPTRGHRGPRHLPTTRVLSRARPPRRGADRPEYAAGRGRAPPARAVRGVRAAAGRFEGGEAEVRVGRGAARAVVLPEPAARGGVRAAAGGGGAGAGGEPRGPARRGPHLHPRGT